MLLFFFVAVLICMLTATLSAFTALLSDLADIWQRDTPLL